LLSLIAHYGLIVVAVIIFCGEMGLPTFIPGEIALLMAGAQVIHSPPALAAAAMLFGVVDLAATSTIHTISRTGGNRLLCRVLRSLQGGERTHEEMMARWRGRLGGRDSLVVFVTRLIPIVRFYASITTGLIRIRVRHFLLGAAPAALLWAAVPLVAGYLLRGQLAGLESQYGTITRAVIAGSVAATVVAALVSALRRVPSHGLRRIRAAVGLAVVFGAFARLTLAVSHSDVQHVRLLVPPVPTLAMWAGMMGALAAAIAWVSLHDLRLSRRHQAAACRIGAVGTVTWLGLLLVVAGFGTFVGVHHVPVQALTLHP
jgi:membrane protein DedA with SNARE-associated domain